MDQVLEFLHRGLTPGHSASLLAQTLLDHGFRELEESAAWQLEPHGGYFFRRGGTALVAFVPGSDSTAGWNVAAAHTDSPGWKLKLGTQKPHPSGVIRVGTEVYGSPIHSTWFDRPLSVAGRVFLRGSQGPREILVQTAPIAVFPNLAIHYNREVNKGQAYDLTEQLSLLVSVGPDQDLQGHLARTHQFDRADWLSADLYAVEAAAPTSLGSEGLFLSPRVDNLTGCHAVVQGLLDVRGRPSPKTRAVFCFDQEEIGSSTWTGADSSLLGDVIARVHGLSGGSPEALHRSKAQSFVLSVDSAHGVHPNWAGQHDEAYAPQLGRGPVLKSSARFSYATTAASEARVRLAAEQAQVSLQTYVMKSTLTPGSTVGPITTSWTGIAGADVGIPIWAMHSCVETAHQADQDAMVKLVSAVLSG